MHRVGFFGGGQHRSDRSREQLGQQRLVGVAVSAEGSGDTEQGGHGVPTQVLCTEEGSQDVVRS